MALRHRHRLRTHSFDRFGGPRMVVLLLLTIALHYGMFHWIFVGPWVFVGVLVVIIVAIIYNTYRGPDDY